MKIARGLALLFTAFGQAVFSQNISVGLRGGVPLNDTLTVVQDRFKNIPKRYVFGPTIEVRLPANLGFVFDVLYQKLEYQQLGTAAASRSGSQWEFPLMLRKRFGQSFARPFLGGGVSFNKISGIGNPVEFVKSSTTGIVFSGGVEVKIPLIRITPEIRYGRRLDDNFKLQNLLESDRNQFKVLVGVTF